MFMKVYLDGREIYFSNRQAAGEKPLAYYIEIAINAVKLSNVSNIEATKYILQHILPNNIIHAHSYYEMTCAIYYIISNQFGLARHKLSNALTLYGSNLYATSLCVDFFSDDALLKGFIESRLIEILYWNGQEDIISIGDSHGVLVMGSIPRCRIWGLGSITMHRVARDGFAALGVAADRIGQGHGVVISLGEIDARMHIVKQSQRQSRPLEQIVTDLADPYFAELQRTFGTRPDIRLIISGIAPPVRAQDTSPDFFYGDDNDRLAAHNLMNWAIKKHCDAMGYGYLDVYGKYCDAKGFIRRNLSDGSHHIGPQCHKMVQRDIENILNSYARRT